jgi:hypothetical protein
MGNIIDQGPVLVELGLAGEELTDLQQAVISGAIRRAEGAVKKHLRYDPVNRSRTEYYPIKNRVYQSRKHIWEATDTVAYIRSTSDASSDELQLMHLPIRGSVAVRVWIDYDGRFDEQAGAFTDEKTEGQDFWAEYDQQDDDGNGICSSGILRSIGLWPLESGSVKVTYTAGYTSDEFNGNSDQVDATPIHEACVMEAVRRAKRAFIVNNRDSQVGFVAGPFTSENLGDYGYNVDGSVASTLLGSQVGLTTETKELLSTFVNYGFML